MHGRIARVVAAGLVGMAVGAGYVHAQGTASSDPIHACADGSGVLRVKAPCGAGESEVVWNEQGPAGTTGAQGPSGDRGPDGAPSSLQGRVVTAGSRTIKAGQSTRVIASCRPGEHVVTGGHQVDSAAVDGDPSEYQITADGPETDGSAWVVSMIGYYSDYRLLVFAVCAPQPGAAR